MRPQTFVAGLAAVLLIGPSALWAQQLEQRLLAESASALAASAQKLGDANRGAIVFHQPNFGCIKCHNVGGKQETLGPDMTKLQDRKTITDEAIVDAILRPSKEIRQGYETVVVLDDSGTTITGLFSSETDSQLVLRDVASNGKLVTLDKDDIEQQKRSDVSIMPAGQVNQLSGRQQFLDLVKYLIEVRDGGAKRALQLQPPAHLLVAPPVAEYEKTIDHAGMISSLDGNSFKRGEAIYSRLCINCHGTKDQPGSLPTSLRFASGKFKNGKDPYAMYQTLTRGFGMMLPQAWMVPQQKYDVIHYVRKAYLKRHNPSQHFDINDDYLSQLPKGDSRGPAPVAAEPWVNMDYGPSMINTIETGKDAKNFAYKAIAVRLDHGPGGVSRGNAWMTFDHDTMRVATAWTKPIGASSFIDWQGIHFNGRHNIHPRVSGQVHLSNPTGPGWANPQTGSFDDPRLVGRDGRKYGPLPNEWATLRGIYSHGPDTIIDYTIGETKIQESPALLTADQALAEGDAPTFARLMNIGPRKREMKLQVAMLPRDDMQLRRMGDAVVADVRGNATDKHADNALSQFSFNGASYAQTENGDAFNMTDRPYSITARIRTGSDGTIFCKTANEEKWVPDGKSFFVRGGRLTLDIGWVGAVKSQKLVDDGRWHDVAVTVDADQRVRFYVDGKVRGGGELRPKKPVKKHVIRVGFTAKDFPAKSHFKGDLQDVRFFQRALPPSELKKGADAIGSQGLVANWKMKDGSLADAAGKFPLVAKNGASPNVAPVVRMAAGLSTKIPGSQWSLIDDKRLCLTIPAGDEPLAFLLWTRSTGLAGKAQTSKSLATVRVIQPTVDLAQRMHGGPARWPERLTTTVQRGSDDGPFAVDVLTAPSNNPWLARVRLTGFDFFDDGDSMAVSDWDGDVWKVTGLSRLDENDSVPVELTWQRIASGLFQPLGVRIVDGRIYVSCRDQICILNDLNGDGETDFYECFNRDHQVTDHFHEFAMGLQTDEEGNFYYAKSARHAKTALVPHHGTLLRVSKDGSKTDILANGFRAANGVCLNPDGTFIVTDQEGHWNPKNRINWVEPGGFYGNMFGYHDVTDSSDEAMNQPLCWITNSFDRSPAELLWVDSEKWGPLNNRLLNLSYGYGKVYIVPHEDIDGQKQGGMCEFPIDQFPTGTMRGRFRPSDGQLYVCGMFAWAGSQQQDGGMYRLRYTGKPVHLPAELAATKQGMQLSFTGELNRKAAEDVDNYSVKIWSLKRTASYGSKHYNERELKVTAARLDSDGKTVSLAIPQITPTWCMEIRYKLESLQGKTINGTIHNTIHNLRE